MSTPRPYQEICATCGDNWGRHYGENCDDTDTGRTFKLAEGVAAPLEPSAEVGYPNLYDRARSELGKVMDKFGVEIPQGDNSIEYLANMLAAAVSKNLQEELAHAVSCMDRSCKRCNKVQREIAALREKPNG